MDVRRVVPGIRQRVRHRHAAAQEQPPAYLPVAEVREGYDGATADPYEILQNRARAARRLQRPDQHDDAEGTLGIVREIGAGVALNRRQAVRGDIDDTVPAVPTAAARTRTTSSMDRGGSDG